MLLPALFHSAEFLAVPLLEKDTQTFISMGFTVSSSLS